MSGRSGLLACVALGSWIGGIISKTRPVAVAFIGSLGYPVTIISWFAIYGPEGFNYEMAPLVFGWRPNPLGYICLLAVLSPFLGYLGGRAAELSVEDTSSDQSPLCRVLAIHWLWLWFPLSSWAFIFPSMVYLFWLALAAMLHWMFHPSLWFNWRWDVFLSWGVLFTYFPLALWWAGVTKACAVLGDGEENGLGRLQVALRFLGWGYGAAMFGSSAMSFIAFWALDKLPIASAHKPWWAFF